MRRLLSFHLVALTPVLLALALDADPASAGKNGNGAMIVHTSDTYGYSAATVCTTPDGDPGSCETAVTRSDRDQNAVVWFLAAFPPESDPGVAVIYFGLRSSGDLDPSAWKLCGPAGSLEVPDADWPYDGGNSVAFGEPVTGDRLFRFYVFRIDGGVSGAYFGTGINPTGGYAAFVDDSNPPDMDLCTRFGEIRWYEDGLNDCPIVLPEACCLPDGSCSMMMAADCVLAGGESQGPASDCDPNPCPQPEACCLPDGSCDMLLPPACESQGGTPLGFGTGCEPDPCETGACCDRDGQCFIRTRYDCEATDGIFLGETIPCDPNPCPLPGACCFETAQCIILLPQDCYAAGGSFLGWMFPCDPNPCPQACCFPDGSCQLLKEENCGELGGYLEYDVGCNPNPCEAWEACCTPEGYCYFLPPSWCVYYGWEPQGPGTNCDDPDPCEPPPPQPGACCLEDGQCAQTTLEECGWQGGYFCGIEIPCEPNPCFGACCLPDGSCLDLDVETCFQRHGSYQGSFTVCGPDLCPPPQIGACCLDDGTCVITAEDLCNAWLGQYLGDGTGCDPNPCAPTATENTSWGRIRALFR